MAVFRKDIALLSVVSVAHAFQLTTLARRTGKMRMKCKVNYPAISGNEDFERAYRAQQNTLEFFPIFASVFWMAGIFFHQVPVAVVGLVYIYARQKYYNGYLESVKGRLPGFGLAVKCLKALLLMYAVGFVNYLLEEYTGINVKGRVMKYIF